MKRKLFTFFSLLLLASNTILAQEAKDSTKTQNFILSADLVTNYIWRGLIFSDAPNLQPNLAFTNDKGNFTLGAWASYSLSDYYSEIDVFASYTLGSFTVSVWDYFIMDQTQANNRYFDYDNNTTGHALEGLLTFVGPESFPLELTVSTFFYGADKDPNGDNYYSTYFEAGYHFKWKANNLKLFIGMTPQEGLYATDLAVCNIGIKNTREIKVNNKFSIPISGSVIVNPNLENIFFVLAITLSANQ